MTEAPVVTTVSQTPIKEAFATTFLAQVVEPILESVRKAEVGAVTKLPGDRFRVVLPIPVLVERGDDGVIVEAHHLDSFGCGDDFESAGEDLGLCLIELFDTLEENRDALSSHLGDVHRSLARHIVAAP